MDGKWQVSASVLELAGSQKTAALQFVCGADPGLAAAAIAYAKRQEPEDDVIPAGPARNSVVGLIGLMDHARKHTWSREPEINEFLRQVNNAVTELTGQLPENKEV